MADVGNREHHLCAEAKELESSVPLCKLEILSGISKSTGTTALERMMLLSPSTLLHWLFLWALSLQFSPAQSETGLCLWGAVVRVPTGVKSAL